MQEIKQAIPFLSAADNQAQKHGKATITLVALALGIDYQKSARTLRALRIQPIGKINGANVYDLSCIALAKQMIG